MKVWLDALTPKQGRLAACLYRSLKVAGHEPFATCREHECTASVLRLYGLEPVVVGRYGGETKLGKLLADAERIAALAELVSASGVQALVSYPNPSAARVAFGLGLPYVALNDTPHADAANRLSLPLCSFLVASEALEGKLERYLAPGAKTLYYKGVDEVLWVRAFEPAGSSLRELGLEAKGYVVVRPEEFKAAYYSWAGWGWLELCEKLRKKGIRVVVLPRYEEQRAAAEKAGFAVPRSCVDGLDLAYHALAVVTGGGTMAREAALLGTPSYYTFPLELEVSGYVERLGFPLKRWSGDAGELADEIASLEEGVLLKMAEKAKEVLKRLEAPDSRVLEALRALEG